MFTIIAFVSMGLIGWAGRWQNEQERSQYEPTPSDDHVWLILLHMRQELRLVAYLPAAVVIMHGIVADRIH
jgi:hypothetical protein